MNLKLKSLIAERCVLACALAGMVLITPAAFADENKQHIISVSATGMASVVPDMAIVQLAVVRQATTARQALSDNSDALTKVLAALKERGLAEKDIQTSNFNISPRYNQPKRTSSRAQKEPPKIIGYSVNNGLVVRVRDISKLGEILDQVVTLGVNSGGNIGFTSSSPDSVIEEARKDAIARALAKAKTLSEAAGVKLGQITNITEQNQRNNRPRAMGRTTLASSSLGQVPIAAGESSFSVTVTVQWGIAE